ADCAIAGPGYLIRAVNGVAAPESAGFGGTVLFSPETSAPARSPGSAAPGTEAPGTGPLLGTPEMDHAVVERRFGGHMSVEPRKLMSEGWTSWQGHVVNGVFPLGRYLGCSRSEEHTSELQSLRHLVCRLLLEKKNGDAGP